MSLDLTAREAASMPLAPCLVSRQRGAITLGLTLVMLAVMALAMMLTAPALMLEQRTAAHQTRATAAFEWAEAGLAWTIARLNDRTALHPASNAACEPSASPNAKPFRDWYAPATVAPDLIDRDHTPPAQTRVACTMAEGGELLCSCPVPGMAPTVATTTARTFIVAIDDEPSDPHALRLTATACINSVDGCSETTRRDGDASARIVTLVKRLPRLASLPNAPLTAGGWLQVCDAVSVENLATTSGGRLAHAGEAVQFGGLHQSSAMPPGATLCNANAAMRLTSSAGDLPAAQMMASDARLARLAADESALAHAFLGQTPPRYGDAACTVTGTSASERASNVLAAYRRVRNPCRHFMLDGDADFTGATLGEPATPSRPAQPVLLATSSDIRLGSGTRIYGLVQLNHRASAWVMAGATVHGAVIARGSLRLAGHGLIQYDLGTLGALAASGDFVRVPGGWMDE